MPDNFMHYDSESLFQQMKTYFVFVSKKTKLVGFILSVIVGAILWFAELPGDLSPDGQKCLAITVFTVIWWVFNVTHPAYSTFVMFLGYILYDLAPPPVVFKLTTQPLMWLMISAFLIAAAVTKSGLAVRVAYFFMIKYAKSYTSIIILIYILGFLLSFMIPHPFPRTLLIMAAVAQILQKGGANEADSKSIGLAVFTSATATSMIIMTGDAMLNLAAISFSGVRIGWLQWAGYMAVPGIAASILMLGLHFLLFKQTGPLEIDTKTLIEEEKNLGPISRDEKVTIFWVLIALALWSTDFIHNINPSWIGMAVVVGLSMPKIGDILGPGDISSGVAWPIVIFVVGALAIGTVGQETGLSQWLADVLLPSDPPSNAFAFAGFVGGGTMIMHMFLGSALACMSIVSPPMVELAAKVNWSPLVPALIVYIAVQIHYLLPFQHVTILLGAGKTGNYRAPETIKFGIPLTAITLFIIILVAVPWWKLVGLI